MNTNDSPLIPQGSFLEQKNKGRARVRIAVFVVLAIHAIGVMALLMQGCKPNAPTTEEPAATNTIAPPSFEPTNEPVVPDTNPPTTATNAMLPPPDTNLPNGSGTAPALPSATTEYKIVKGDTLAGLAKKHGISLKALMDANPGVDATKLKIGQAIKIPAAAPRAGASASNAIDAGSGAKLYEVKSGDSLTKIASDHGISIKALRTANNLATDRIRVGQRLKIPAKPVAPAFTAPSDNAPTNK